jgi:hypothetical protein
MDSALEEAWVYSTVKDFEYILSSDKYSYIDLTTIMSKDAQKALLVILQENNDVK